MEDIFQWKTPIIEDDNQLKTNVNSKCCRVLLMSFSIVMSKCIVMSLALTLASRGGQ